MNKHKMTTGKWLIILIPLGFLSFGAMAQTLVGAGTWATQCVTCHDAGLNNTNRPIFGSGPSNAGAPINRPPFSFPSTQNLSTNLNAGSSFFKTYVRSLGQSLNNPMKDLDADAPQLRAYLIQRLYGQLTGSDFSFSADPSGDPLPVVSYQFTANTINTVNASHPVLSIKNNRSTPITYGMSGIPGSPPPAGYWYTDDPSCVTSQTPVTYEIPAGGACQVTLNFKPDTVSTPGASLIVTIDGVSQAVSLSAQDASVPLPTLTWFSLGSTSISFGSVATNTAATPVIVTLENNDPTVNSSVTLNAINLSGANDFRITACKTTLGALVTTLAHGESCQLTVDFIPGSSGLKNATLQIVSTGISPTPLNFDGTGDDGPPQLSVSDSSLAFGTIKVGARSDPIDLRLSSGVSSPVHVTGMSASGPYSIQSKDCPSLPFDLQRGSSCTITVTFNPSSVGAVGGALHIDSDAAPASADVSLSGLGEATAKTSGGGCSLAPGDSPFDPVLWALILGAAMVLARRHVVLTARELGHEPMDGNKS